MRRKYQQGHVYQKGRQKSDPWLPSDRPTCDSGATFQEKLTKAQAHRLGYLPNAHDCRTTGRRKARTTRHQLNQQFIEATTSISFASKERYG